MPIDVQTEKVMTLREAAEHMGVRPKTVWMWARYGLGNSSDPGTRRLETVAIGSRRYGTTLAAIKRWSEFMQIARDVRRGKAIRAPKGGA